ncbi:MAG: FtsX-like permease family protein [Pirellulaceae bacterium]|nr:FtsX-like permease family protein [Pirellulaceae bacterium]
MRTQLAWKNLTSSWSKCLLASAGVGFAVVLMFMQIGFRNALIDSNTQVFSLFDLNTANLAVANRARYNVSAELRFPRLILDAIAAQPEVSRVGMLSLERGTAGLQIVGRPARPVRVIAVDDVAADFFVDTQLKQKFSDAVARDACLVDTESKPWYGLARTQPELQQQHIELNGRRLTAVDFFRLGTDFGNDGTLLMSQAQHARYFPWRSPTRLPSDMVDMALLQVQPAAGRQLADVAAQIRQLAPDLLDVRPSVDFVQREKQFWSQATPIGKIFFLGTVMGLIVGAIICYQIQFTDINDHMSEFATLRAMGYGPGYFWRLVLSQSMYLAVLGFLPGCILSVVLYQVLAKYSGLVMLLTWERGLLVFVLTMLMCTVSGGLAIRKLFRSDPASLF